VADRWDVAALLADGSRRALYDFVRRQDHPVGREEAADATGMSRGLAAFHLDKLVEAGLLAAWCQAPPDQPRGRGRAPKVYQAIGDGLSLTMPARRYELIAEILADAVARNPERADDAARHLARRRGRDLGGELREAGSDLLEALAALGFEPESTCDGVLLRNCPFHALAARQAALVCGLNHSFLAGLVTGLQAHGVHTRLVPRPGACCVELRTPPASAL
jgi:predicted ArsR family transcriptional regulator